MFNTNISYKLIIFYSPFNFEQSLQKISLIENLLRPLDIDIYRKGWIEYLGLEFKDLRKKKISKTNMKEDLKSFEKDNFKQLGYYIFDNSFSNSTPPQVLINLNFYNIDFGLYYKKENLKMKSSFLIAIANNIHQEKSDFGLGKFEEIFFKFNGAIGYIFEQADFYYDGSSDLAWAYQNIHAKIKSNDISQWEEKGVKILGNITKE